MKKIVEKLTAKKDLMVENIKDKKGFTLIELIVVMAIMAILVLVAAPMFLNYTKDAAVTQLTQDARVLSDAAFQYNIANEGWPEDGEGTFTVTGLVKDPTVAVADREDVDLTDAEFVKMDEEALKDFVSSTSNPIEEYVLVVKGDHEGSVFKVDGEEDREGHVHYGLEAAVPKAE